jgi:fibronectin type 3 domain-containing protein
VPGNNTPPKQVTGLLAMALGTNEIMLTWDPSNADDLKCYNVYRSTSANNNYIWLFSPSENYYRDTGLDQSVAYYYYVTAIDYSNNESYKPEKPEQSSGASAITLAPVVLELFGREN